LICLATTGIIFSTYTADNIFSRISGENFAVSLIPEARLIFSDPLKENKEDNYFGISAGLMIILVLSIVLFALDIE
jgi:hypothetical protein